MLNDFRQSLKGKTVVVTGAGQGIGRVVALAVAAVGANVILLSRTEKDLAALQKELYGIGNGDGKKHEYHALDVSDFSAMQNLSRTLASTHKNIDGLVNCAGILGPVGRLDTIDLQAFLRTMQINLMGTVHACALFSSLMQNRHAKIVNFSGGGAIGALANYSAYACSKAAVVRLTENLSIEFASLGIEVNAVSPGFVATRIHQGTLQAGEKAGKDYLESTKKRLESGSVPPEKAAELVVWLLSNESNGVNGKLISAPFDDWKNSDFVQALKEKKNLGTLRRIDDRYFSEKVV